MLRISLTPVLRQPDRFEDVSQLVSQREDICSDLSHFQLRLFLRGGEATEAPLGILFLVDRFTEPILQAGDDVRGGLEVGEVVAKEKRLQPLQPALLCGVRE